MTDRSKLLALAEAVEKLTGPDREVDAQIYALTPEAIDYQRIAVRLSDASRLPRWHDGWVTVCGDKGENDPYPEDLKGYTISLDAAMTLVPTKPFPELRPGEWWWSVDSLGCDAHVAYENHDAGIPEYSARVATPALALCAAALRAQAEALS